MKELPLNGIQVLEFGHEIAGPATGMILADLGATVIHIDKPNVIRRPCDAIFNRGKKCITLDLKTKDGLIYAKKLISKADILIENFRPSVMKKLGLCFEDLSEEYPHLITLSLPSFSKNDNEMKHRKGTEAVVATHSGVFSKMGPNRVLMGVEPSFSPLPLSSAYGATIGAAAVVTALQSREITGYGDCIEVPLAAALTEGLIAYNAIDIENQPKRYTNLREKEIQRRTENNIPFDMSYEDLFSSKYMDPFFRPYKCKDGRTYYLVSIAHKEHPVRVMKALNVYESILEKINDMGSYSIDDVYLPKKSWGKAGSFSTYPISPEWSEMINIELEVAFLTKTALEWEKELSNVGAVGGMHRTLKEWMLSKHVSDSGLFIKINDVEFGPMSQPGAISWSEELKHVHTQSYKSREFITPEEALSVFKNTEKPQMSGHRGKGWLDGIKVLDLSNVIAGPHSASILSRFGANITKIDSASPMFGPAYITYAFNTGQSKKSILLDIKSDKGYEILTNLIKDVDVVILNATTKQIGKLKLDAKSIESINPKVIFCHLDLYGGPLDGEFTNHLGYDDVAQAVSGIMTRFGGGLSTPEEHAHLGTLDVMCGFAASLSIAVSLFHRNKTGKPLRARTSLAAMSGLLQAPFAYDYEGREDSMNEVSGRDIKGNHELSQLYKCMDNYIFIDSNEKEISKLEQIFPKIKTTTNKNKYLTEIFKQKNAKAWLQLLISQDIAAAELNTMDKLRSKFTSPPDGTAKISNGSYSFTQWENHPSGSSVNIVDPYSIQPKYASIYELTPTEKYGKSTRDVLIAKGYSEEDIDKLVDNKIVSYSWSSEYYPS